MLLKEVVMQHCGKHGTGLYFVLCHIAGIYFLKKQTAFLSFKIQCNIPLKIADHNLQIIYVTYYLQQDSPFDKIIKISLRNRFLLI